MNVEGIEVLIPAGAAIAGLILGALLARTSRRDKRRVEELEVRVDEREAQIAQLEGQRAELETRLAGAERERDEAQEALASYQQEVVGHFNQTSDLLKEMTLQYRSIYEHLARGAEALCPEGTLALDASTPIEGLVPPGAGDGHAANDERAGNGNGGSRRKHGAEGKLGDGDSGSRGKRGAELKLGDDDGESVESAHTDPPLQIDPRPDA